MPLPGRVGITVASQAIRAAGLAIVMFCNLRLSRTRGPRTSWISSPSWRITSPTTRSFAVAVVAKHGNIGRASPEARGRSAGSQAGSRGPNQKCSGPRRPRTSPHAQRCVPAHWSGTARLPDRSGDTNRMSTLSAQCLLLNLYPVVWVRAVDRHGVHADSGGRPPADCASGRVTVR